VKAEIDKYQSRIKDIRELLDNRRSARSSSSSGNQEIIRRLQTLKNEFQSVLVRGCTDVRRVAGESAVRCGVCSVRNNIFARS
jgi:hypothetical protein